MPQIGANPEMVDMSEIACALREELYQGRLARRWQGMAQRQSQEPGMSESVVPSLSETPPAPGKCTPRGPPTNQVHVRHVSCVFCRTDEAMDALQEAEEALATLRTELQALTQEATDGDATG